MSSAERKTFPEPGTYKLVGAGGFSSDVDVEDPVPIKKSKPMSHRTDADRAAYQQELDLGAPRSATPACVALRAVWDSLFCCCSFAHGATSKLSRQSLIIICLLLVSTSWIPICGAAWYATDTHNAPQLAWYWMFPMLAMTMALVFTVALPFSLNAPQEALEPELSAMPSAYNAGVLRYHAASVTVVLLLVSSSLVLNLMFLWADYLGERNSRGQHVNVVPGLLASCSTLMLFVTLLLWLKAKSSSDLASTMSDGGYTPSKEAEGFGGL